jgi:hypothetical protein
VGTDFSFPGEKRHETKHSLPSSAQVENAWSSTSTPIRLHAVVLKRRNNLSLFNDVLNFSDQMPIALNNIMIRVLCIEKEEIVVA